MAKQSPQSEGGEQSMNDLKLKHDSKDGQELVSAFCVHADWIVAIFSMYAEIYYFDDTLQLIDKENEHWYHLNARAIIQCILMEFAKVTDPKDSGVDKENLSVNFMVDSIDWPGGIAQRLDDLRLRMNKFSEYIVSARHKMLAHLAVEAAKSRKRYGEFPEGKDRKFVQNLREFCKIAYEASFLNRWGVRYSGMYYAADVQYLKTTLAKARAFDALVRESEQVTTRILSLLQDQLKIPLRPSNWDYLRQSEEPPPEASA